MATQGDYRARFAAAYQRAVNEEEFVDGLDLDYINKCSVVRLPSIDKKFCHDVCTNRSRNSN